MLLSIALAASLAAAQAAVPAAPAPADQPAAPASPEQAPAASGAEEETPYRALARAARAAGPPRTRDDNANHVRLMARSDLDDSRFFNRPGATRVQFDGDWEHCRQIARRLAGSRSGGAWMQSGFVHGGVVGGLLAGGFDAAFSERRERRDIRRYCLMTRGWRMVEPDEAHRRRITRLSRGERVAYIDRMIGAQQVEDAEVTDLAVFLAAKAEAQ